MMKLILIAMVFLVAGCNGNDIIHSNSDRVISNGETLFKNNCANCHKVDKDFTGPALRGSLQRWGGDKKMMYDFIRNPAKLVVENAYAKQLFEKWHKTMMTPARLSDVELDSIMNFCETYSGATGNGQALPGK